MKTSIQVGDRFSNGKEIVIVKKVSEYVSLVNGEWFLNVEYVKDIDPQIACLSKFRESYPKKVN